MCKNRQVCNEQAKAKVRTVYLAGVKTSDSFPCYMAETCHAPAEYPSMHKSILAYSQVPQLAKTDIAYAGGDDRLIPFFTYAPKLESFSAVLAEKATRQYPRKDLVSSLQRQYAALPVKQKVQQQIDALADDNTYTIVTAHQPVLLTGPLYFVYKALTAIQLAQSVEALSQGKQKVVPVFVLGSEDHDLDEVNKANIYGKTLVWQPGESGPVGCMDVASLAPVLEELKAILGDREEAQALFREIQQCYTGKPDFAAATQALLHEWLGDLGLVVLNMNDSVLKRHFIPIIKAELLEQPAHKLVNETIAQLSALGFKAQAAPREINLFYMLPGLRERIVLENGVYQVLNTEIRFSQAEILHEVEQYPERFSPNVVLRPLYQELILPNLAYVGGGGELAYWLERKSLFAHFNLSLPVLVRRHSLLWLDRDAAKKLQKTGFSAAEFFADTDSLVRQFIARNAEVEVSLDQEMATMQQLYNQLAAKAKAIDPTLEKSLLAESVKAVAGLEQWQSRLVRAEKQKHDTALQQLRSLKEKLYPGNGLQERYDNVLPYLLKYGKGFFQTILDQIAPFDPGFVILEESPEPLT